MEFYDVVTKRRTIREFLDKEVDFETIKRILEAGNKAPTWNHKQMKKRNMFLNMQKKWLINLMLKSI